MYTVTAVMYTVTGSASPWMRGAEAKMRLREKDTDQMYKLIYYQSFNIFIMAGSIVGRGGGLDAW
jgi:hypothetical protein